jgi:hypothetical protein
VLKFVEMFFIAGSLNFRLFDLALKFIPEITAHVDVGDLLIDSRLKIVKETLIEFFKNK